MSARSITSVARKCRKCRSGPLALMRIGVVASALVSLAAWAQTQPPAEPLPAMDHGQMKGMDHGQGKGMSPGPMKGMDHGQMKEGMDHGKMDHGKMDHGKKEEGAAPKKEAAEPGAMKDMDMKGMDMDSMMKSMQGGRAPADARDPDAYSNGLTLGHMAGMDMADDTPHAYLILDRLEAFHTRDGNGQALDAQAWYGGDIDKLWLKLDGERTNGRLGATRMEALWNHAIAPYWGLQLGVRHDVGDGPSRNWAAFGVQGLAPYWFEVQATAYVGPQGRTALRFEAEYELLLTQRLVL
ncbi:MAG: copper resistance protein B, partial [Caldimonas sp.]